MGSELVKFTRNPARPRMRTTTSNAPPTRKTHMAVRPTCTLFLIKVLILVWHPALPLLQPPALPFLYERPPPPSCRQPPARLLLPLHCPSRLRETTVS